MKRIFLIVLDSVGIGAAPDAESFGDVGANTLASVSHSAHFCADNLVSLGLGNIHGVDCVPSVDNPKGSYGRMVPISAGKDTTIGHWEISGIESRRPLPTYPFGFPEDVIQAFSRATGRGVLCNRPYSGTKVIADYGEEHMRSGALIVYTSADSVFQIAAHERAVPPQELYRCCEVARALLKGQHGVGRVIARPFIGEAGAFTRTANRRDFSLEPTGRTMLDLIKESGKSVIGVGKISDIFAGRGICESIHTHSNAEGMAVASSLLLRDFTGLAFINLVDFDMLYGHRNDVDGYAAALADFDRWLPSFMSGMGKDDALMITADHGCDPAFEGTDHTRECTPLLICSQGIVPSSLGVRCGFCDIGATVCELLGIPHGEIRGEAMPLKR